MEKENNLSERILKSRPALTDTTNLPSKRPFSLISGDDVVDTFVKKKCHTHNNNDVLLQSKGKNPCFESPIRIDNSPDDVNSQEPNTRSGKSEERNETSGGSLEKLPNDEGFVDRANEVDDKEVCVVEDLGPHKFGCVTVEPPTIPASSGSKFLGLERCLGLKSQDYAKSPVELLKECTCSFCTKAGYIWSDINYQDVKGRLSAVRKSQKEANMVVKKFCGIKDAHDVIHNQQDCPDPANLELALMQQYKSLFVYSESKFAQESNQLESRLDTLKKLRDNCKNELGSIDKSNFDNQQHSDAYCDCKIPSHFSRFFKFHLLCICGPLTFLYPL